MPKMAHGSVNLSGRTASRSEIIPKTLELYDRIVDPKLTVRRMYVVANHIIPVDQAEPGYEQLDLFSAIQDPSAGRPGGLVADKKDRAVRSPEIVL